MKTKRKSFGGPEAEEAADIVESIRLVLAIAWWSPLLYAECDAAAWKADTQSILLSTVRELAR